MREFLCTTTWIVLASSALAQNIGGDNKPAQQPAPSTATAKTTAAPTTPSAPATTQPDSTLKFSGGYSHQFNTSIEEGGSYDADRAYFGISSHHTITDTITLSLGIGYEYDSYRFSGTSVFATTAWNNVETLGVLPRFDFKLDDHWTVGAAPLLQLSGETNADAGKTITGGALANFRYSFDPSHVLGLGLLAKNQLDNSVLVVPVPIVDWEIQKGLRISNVRGPEANPFVGLELVRELSTQFNTAIGGAWEYRMFRLSDSGSFADGAGVEQQITLYGRLEWRPVAQFRVDFVAGASLMNQLKLYDRTNNFVASENGGASLVLGVFASYKF